MSGADAPQLPERIVKRGREVVVQRLREAFAHQAAARGGGVDLDPARLERMVQEAVSRAGDALWRRSLAEAVMQELGLDLPAALADPLLAEAQALINERGADIGERGAEPARAPAAVPGGAQALRFSAVHLSGIEALPHGDADLELRLSAAGLDVLKRSDGAAIGRLEWSEISSVELPVPRRGLRGRRSRELHVSTGRGQARFELPGMTDEELHGHLEPMLARLRDAGNRQPERDSDDDERPREGSDRAAEDSGGTAGSPAGAG